MDSKKIIILLLVGGILFGVYWFGFRQEEDIMVLEGKGDEGDIPVPSSPDIPIPTSAPCVPRQEGEDPWDDNDIPWTELQWYDAGWPTYDYDLPNRIGLAYLKGINVRPSRRTMMKYAEQIFDYIKTPNANGWGDVNQGEFLCIPRIVGYV